MSKLFQTHYLRHFFTLLLVTLLLTIVGCLPSSDPTANEDGAETGSASTTNDVTTEESDPEPTTEPVEEPTAEPVEEPTTEPVEEPTAEPVEEPTTEPVEEPTAEPVEEQETGQSSDSAGSNLPGNSGQATSSSDESDGSQEAESTEAESTEAESTEAESTEAESTEDESTEAESTEAESTEAESTEAESTEDESTEAESTEAESTEAESTEAESTEAESTEAESTEAESTEAESTEAESTEAESTEAESTEAEENAPEAIGAAAALAPAARNNMYNQVPPMVIDPELFYYATFQTVQGDIVVQLFAERAPVTVNNFVYLAQDGFYNNTTFHRVIEGFMAQAGDPTGSGAGGPGYTFEDEFFPGLGFDKAGLLAMANRGPATNGSQVFLTFGPTQHLNDRHTIFGEVIEGMDVLNSITIRDPQTSATAGDEIYTIAIEEASESTLAKPTPPPPTPTPLPTPTPYAPSSLDGSTRPLAQLNRPDRADLFNVEPEMVIDASKSYVAVFSTNKGIMRFDLDAVSAPKAVNNLVVVAQLGYYDNMPINQVNPQQFVIAGAIVDESDEQPVAYDVGYDFAAETGTDVVPAVGVLAYIPTQQADDGAILSSGSQLLFALTEPPPQSAGQFSFFGQISEGLDILESLTAEDVISKVEIEIE